VLFWCLIWPVFGKAIEGLACWAYDNCQAPDNLWLKVLCVWPFAWSFRQFVV